MSIALHHEQPLPTQSISPSPTSLTTATSTFSASCSDSCSDSINSLPYASRSNSLNGPYPDLALSLQQVQQTWKARRAERDQQNTIKRGGKPMTAKPNQSQLQLQRPPSLPSLCTLVQNTWAQVFQNKTVQIRNAEAKPSRVFPSLLTIIQSHSLVTQVRDLQDESTVSDFAMQSVLSILPAGYDWNAAILQMAQYRSRAFLLLDLAAIVRRTVLWKRSHPNITWVHSVSTNANPKLLQVLLLAGVRLVTSTRTDLNCALNAISKLKKPPKHECIADSTTHTAPPDSYIREMLKAKVTSLAVDGPQEVHRLVQTVQRMQARLDDHDSYNLELVLRLRSNPSSWMQLVESTAEAISQYPEHRLSGISFDIGSPETWKERQDHAQQVIKCILRNNDSVKISLTGFEQEPFPCEWVEWWTSMQSDARVAEVAVECSHPLVASAGALCTRIIGVREQSSDKVLKQSLYIDDGCYGSLCQTHGELNPIPLGNDHEDSKSGLCYSSTIWGPTCDGLDRVCRDIHLPKLDRDDWLVFPNLGCPGSLDTAFNGFDAPDTVYCVLGYFK